MCASTEGFIDKAIKYGAVFAEVRSLNGVLQYENQKRFDTHQLNPVAKAVFGLASVTFEVRVRQWRMR